MDTLKKRLFEAYGGFSDKRVKNLERSEPFTVDDRSDRDLDARGDLFLWFCAIHVEVLSREQRGLFDDVGADSKESGVKEDLLRVSLRGNVPMSTGVQEWIRANSSRVRESSDSVLAVEIGRGEEPALRDLADQIRAIVARNAPRYSTESYKYVCPRTADSLDRLAATLKSAWSE